MRHNCAQNVIDNIFPHGSKILCKKPGLIFSHAIENLCVFKSVNIPPYFKRKIRVFFCLVCVSHIFSHTIKHLVRWNHRLHMTNLLVGSRIAQTSLLIVGVLSKPKSLALSHKPVWLKLMY